MYIEYPTSLTISNVCQRVDQEYCEDIEDSQDCLYFTGNSLGLQPKAASELIQGEMEKWAKRGLEGYFTGKYPWFSMEDFITEESARIVGGKAIEVTIMNALTVNVHLSMVRHARPLHCKDHYGNPS